MDSKLKADIVEMTDKSYCEGRIDALESMIKALEVIEPFTKPLTVKEIISILNDFKERLNAA